MDRLTERDKEGQAHAKTVGYYSLIDKLAEYEDLEEQGLLLKLSVSEGTIVYLIDYSFDCKHDYNCPLSYNEYKCEEDIRCQHEVKTYRVREVLFNICMKNNIGKNVFLTRKEAEDKLKELQS